MMQYYVLFYKAIYFTLGVEKLVSETMALSTRGVKVFECNIPLPKICNFRLTIYAKKVVERLLTHISLSQDKFSYYYTIQATYISKERQVNILGGKLKTRSTCPISPF